MLGWSLYKTRAVLRGERPVRSEEISHISVKTEGEVSEVHWNEWAAKRTEEDAENPERLGRMPLEGGNRAKGKPVSVVLYQEHMDHLKSLAARDGVSFSAAVRNIIDTYFQSGVEDVNKPLVLGDAEEQSSSCDEVEVEQPIYDEALIQQLVEEQGASLNFDEDDVRRFLAARNSESGEG